MITRYIEQQFLGELFQGKTLIIYGPRQAGKTTFVKNILSKTTKKTKYISSDLRSQVERLYNRDEKVYSNMLAGLDILVIDEAQNIPDIGLCLKIIHDHFPHCQVIATGSSSFELAQRIQEPLTGRKRIYTLLPLGIHELFRKTTRGDFAYQLSDILLYGLYPEIYTAKTVIEKQTSLEELVESYLFKDILIFSGVKKSDSIIKLAKLLAYQIGKPVSINELATKLKLNVRTIESYLTILEQAFVIFTLPSYSSKNPRKELSKGKKIYFRDVGIRNALIGMFQDIELRGDKGELWENFVIAEMMKKKLHSRMFGNYYFRRTYQDQEIDLIYDLNDELQGREIKWKQQKHYSIPSSFKEVYKDSTVKLITIDSFLDEL